MLCYGIKGFKPGMLRLETCMETWLFEQSSCWKYCMLVGEICRHGIKCILSKTTNTTVKGTLTQTVRYSLIWHCSLPVLNSSCTGVISERHSSLGAKQGTGLATKLKHVTPALNQHNIIIQKVYCLSIVLKDGSLDYTK